MDRGKKGTAPDSGRKRRGFGEPGAPEGMPNSPEMAETLRQIMPDFKRWRRVFIQIDCIFVVLGFVFELFFVILRYCEGNVNGISTGYLFYELILPTLCNLLILVWMFGAGKRMGEEDFRRNIIPVLAMTFIGIVFSMSNCTVYTPMFIFCVPICMTTVFSFDKLCKVITTLSFVGVILATVRHCILAANAVEIGRIILSGILVLSILGIECIVALTLLKMTDVQKRRLVELVLTSKEAHKRAEAANRAKSEFLANMSHEIRTPINAILGMNEMVLRESENEQITEYANSIHSASTSLLYLINDVLDFSKIESGKMEIIEASYDTASFVHDCYNMVSERAEKKGLELKIECSPELPSLLFGDEIRLRQVITNLLSNAAKYTEKGSIHFSIDGRKEGEQFILSVTVKDTGIGIKKENLDKLFNQFTRFDLEKNRTIEGTGLGLAIAGKLMQLMHGEIQVESTYGEGSTFRAVIPQKIINGEPIGDFMKRYRDVSRKNEKYRQTFEAPDARILVVDDIEVNLMVIQNLLKKTKIQVDKAVSGRQCLAMAGEYPYDIIFLDHMMPEMDGLETLAEMKKMNNPLNGNTPVIMLTANAVAGVREQYMEAGFVDYLSKPVSGEKLEMMIAKYLPKDKVKTVFSDEEDKKEEISKEELEKFAMPDIDVKAGIERQGGTEAFLELLDLFYTSGLQKTKLLKTLYEKRDRENYVIEVHGLKSAAANIGAIQLSEEARQHEEAGKHGDLAFIEEHIEGLLVSYERILEEIRDSLEKQSYGQFAQKESGELKRIEEKELSERINDAYQEVSSFHSKEAAKSVEELLNFALPEDVREKVEKVRNLLKMYEDEQAEDILGELTKSFQE